MMVLILERHRSSGNFEQINHFLDFLSSMHFADNIKYTQYAAGRFEHPFQPPKISFMYSFGMNRRLIEICLLRIVLMISETWDNSLPVPLWSNNSMYSDASRSSAFSSDFGF